MPEQETATTTTATPTTPITPKVEAADSNDLVDRLVQRYGNERAALAVLADENFQYRTRHRDDTNKIAQMTPFTLTQEEKNLFEQYKGLGTFDEVKKFKEEHPQLTQKIEDYENGKKIASVAKIAGYKESVLADQMKAKDIEVEVVVEGEGDDEEEVAYAQFKGKKDSRMKLSEFAEKNLPDYIPALTASDDTRNGDKETPTVVRVPRQVGNLKGQGSRKTNPAKAYIQSAYKTPAEVEAEKSNSK